MTTPTTTTSSGITRTFTVSRELFDVPQLDIYSQMTCIILSSYTNEATLPSLEDIERLGRMSTKQVKRALQQLVQMKMLSHKAFSQIVGEFGDDRLSWAAKGLLAYYNTHPQATYEELIQLSEQSRDDIQSVKKAIDELTRYGYLNAQSEVAASKEHKPYQQSSPSAIHKQ